MKNRHSHHKSGKASVPIYMSDHEQRLVAIKDLLKVDLEEVRFEQEESARAALRDDPSDFELMLAVKRWARAIAAVCRAHAGRCAEIHAGRGDRDPATSAMGTILLALSDHLGLPVDGTLLCQDWPEQNDLCNFVLYVACAPIKLIDGDFVTEPKLPRWEPKSRLARLMAGLNADHFDSSPFLSVDETRHVLRGLEESFRTTLLERLGTSFSECYAKLAANGAQHPLVPQLKSRLRIAVFACLAQNRDATDQEILDWLRQNNPKVIPASWDADDSLPGKTFTKVRQYINQHDKMSTTITRR